MDPEDREIGPDVIEQREQAEKREAAREKAEHLEAQAREQRRIEAAASASLEVLERGLAEELDRQKEKPKALDEKIAGAREGLSASL